MREKYDEIEWIKGERLTRRILTVKLDNLYSEILTEVWIESTQEDQFFLNVEVDLNLTVPKI